MSNELKITKFAKDMTGTVETIDKAYSNLVELRRSFPTKFLTKEGIKVHLVDTESKYTKRMQKIEQEVNTVQVEIKKLKAEYEKKRTEDVKCKLISLKDKFTILNSRRSKLGTINLESSPERIRYFYEDLLIFVSNCKHEALDLWKYAYAVHDEVKVEIDYYSAKIFLEDSETYLQSIGFTRISQKEREAYLNSIDGYKQSLKLLAKARAIKDTCRHLLSAFESDEVNYRKFAERNHNI